MKLAFLNHPKIIKFPAIGDSSIGYLSVSEKFKGIDFDIKRVYWTYSVPNNIKRGGHANIEKELVLIAVAGTIRVEIEVFGSQTKEVYVLNEPNIGLYLPPLCWHTMHYSHDAVQLVLASNNYNENDYIRDYSEFLNYKI